MSSRRVGDVARAFLGALPRRAANRYDRHAGCVLRDADHLAARIVARSMTFSPFFHVIELARAPLMGTAPSLMSWFVVLAVTFVGTAFTFPIYVRYRRRIEFVKLILSASCWLTTSTAAICRWMDD